MCQNRYMYMCNEDKVNTHADCCKLLQLYLTLGWTNNYTILVLVLHEWCFNTDTTAYNTGLVYEVPRWYHQMKQTTFLEKDKTQEEKGGMGTFADAPSESLETKIVVAVLSR